MRRIIMSLIAAALIIGCTEKEGTAVPSSSVDIRIITSTRSFSPGDTIGVYAVPTGAAPGNIAYPGNIPLTFDGTYWKPAGEDFLFVTQPGTDIYAYYPYDQELGSATGKLDPRSYPADVSGDQSLFDADMMLARATIDTDTDNALPLAFEHLFGRLTFNIILPDNPDSPVLELHNLYATATVDLTTGGVITGTEMKIITPSRDTDAGNTFYAAVPPQTIAAGTPLLLIKYGTSDTVYASDREIAVNGGRNITFNITVVPTLRRNKVYLLSPHE